MPQMSETLKSIEKSLKDINNILETNMPSLRANMLLLVEQMEKEKKEGK